MGRKHRIRVTPEELERYERSLVKPKGRETPLAMTDGSMQWLNPLKEPKRIRAPSSERRRERNERPMTPRTAARRSRLISNKSPGKQAGPRGYLCEVPSSAKGKRIVAKRRADAQRDAPGYDSSRRQASRTLSASRRRPSSGAADRSRAPLWAAARQRPSSVAASMQSLSQPSAMWDRTQLAPAPSTCSLRPQRSMINEADRGARLALRASAEATSRQRLLATMASDPRPFTAPAARSRRSASPARSPRASSRSSAAGRSDRSSIQVEHMSVQTAGAVDTLGHRGEHSALMLEIIRAEGVAELAVAMADSAGAAAEADPEVAAANSEKTQSFCQVSLEGATWHTPVTVGNQPEWRHLKTTFVEDKDSCIVLDIMSALGGKDLADGAHHSCVAIKVSDLPTVSSEHWYPLSRFNGECATVATHGNAPEGTPRVLLRAQFVHHAASAEAEYPDMHEQLQTHHKELSGLSETCAGQLSVTVVAGRGLGGETIPVDSFAVVEYNGRTTSPTDAVFGATQPEWNAAAGPFSVSPPDRSTPDGPHLVIRVHRWRAIHQPAACVAAYELLGAAAIDIRHAIHKWARTTATAPEKSAEIVVEAWIHLHSWAETNDSSRSDSSQVRTHGGGGGGGPPSSAGSGWPSVRSEKDRLMGKSRRSTKGVVNTFKTSGNVFVRLAFEPSAFVRVERPLPYVTQLQVTLCQCHRLVGDLNSAVMIELSLHRSAHSAALTQLGSSVETWQSKTVHEMFSPTFFETFSFSLHGCDCCLRLDVYEISGLQPPTVHESPRREGSQRSQRALTKSVERQSKQNLGDIDSDPLMLKSTDRVGSIRRRPVKKMLLCSSVVPFMRLIGAPDAHWYSLLPQIEVNHSMHSKKVDHLLRTGHPRHKHKNPDEVELPHGAVQFTAKMLTGNEGAADTVAENHVHKTVVAKRHHARVSIKNCALTGLPRVQATGRTGTGINKRIEPSPMVRFAFGNNSQQTSVQNSTFDAVFRDVIHLPFSWLDDGDGDLEPEELQAEMRLHGGLTCKVYHRAPSHASEREQLIGSVTLSLVELISAGGHSASPGPRTYTIFNTTGHSVRQLKATGTITIEATVEFEGQDELGAGETWEDPEYDSPGARGDHHLAVPTTKLHYMLKTAASLEALPMVDLDPELREPPAAVDLSPKPQDLVSQMDFQCGAAADESGPTVTSLQITVHCMRNIPETVARPVCRVYISSPPAGASPTGSARSLVSPTVLSSSAQENAFVLAPDRHFSLTIDKKVSFNLPQIFAPETATEEPEEDLGDWKREDEFDFGETIRPPAEPLPEERVLHVEIFENVAASDEGEVVLGALLGGVVLPVAQAGQWCGAGQQWHSLSAVAGGDLSFAADANGTDLETQRKEAISPGLELSLTSSTALRKLAPFVVCASSTGAVDETELIESEDDEPQEEVDETEYHHARNNVRVFYDTTDLESLDDPHEIEAVLVFAKDIWSRHHSFDYSVEDLMPIMLEVFNQFKRENLPAEWEAKALKNIEDWVHIYKEGALKVWTFKHFSTFWRQVIDDTVKYAIWLGEAFRDFYCRSAAATHFEVLDEDNSGTLEGAERDNLISWILSFVYGADPSPSVERQMQAEAMHFRHRLDDDGDAAITFDELHGYIFAQIKWMESLRVRQEVALDSAKDRAIAVLQSAARGWLQRRALLSLLLDSIPAPSKEAMIFVEKIPLADAQPFKLRSYALKHWGAVRAIAVRTKPDGEMPEGLSPADMARWKADDQMRDFPRSWAVVWMESKDKAAAAVAGQEEAIASKKQYFSSATPAGPPTGQQFGIRKCDWTRIHSGKAITLLSKIWKSVPMAVVSSIPRGFAEEGKVRALFTQFGPVDAIGVANEKDQSWALVTFRHETSILKATSQPVEVGADAHLLHVEKAQFSQVTELNKLTVQEQRGWDPLAEAGGVTGGLAGAAAGAKSKAPQKSETAAGAEEVAARLHFSFQTNPANIERIVDRQVVGISKKSGRLTGGKVEYKVVWQGRFVSASWVSRDMMVQFATTRGMVLEYEDNLAEAAAEALEATTAGGQDRKRR